jgi:hypothetical protein
MKYQWQLWLKIINIRLAWRLSKMAAASPMKIEARKRNVAEMKLKIAS